MKVALYQATGKLGTTNVTDVLFGQPVNQPLLAQAIRVYQSNQRQVAAGAQTRSDVNRTTKKWFKQKGTGNARHGARNAPQFVGGGVAHGPTGLENWKKSLSTPMKQRALVSALSAQVAQVVVTDEVAQLKGKTQAAAKLVAAASSQARRILVVLEKSDPMVVRSLRNLPLVMVCQASRLTAWEVALADSILITSGAIEALEARVSGQKSKVATTPAQAKKAVKAEKPAEVTAKPAVKKTAAKPKVVKKATKKVAK